MNIGDSLHGFELISVTPVQEIKAKFHLFRHSKTGAELLWTCREDENKTFAVAFKTIPQDNTGVFHILEHSVLCGSAKYPVKEPFVELMKGSMQTFLNAMTFPDKTVYPVASRNDADFRNLMSVYLDAVFAPSILTNAHIFEQEGWHYEPTEDGRQHVVGVVYGEMEGAFSSVNRAVYQNMNTALYPDTCYGLCSGGDPVAIPELTYEQFVETYKRFYHPSNARFFLDGSVDLDTAMTDICEYVDACERRELEIEDVYQQPVAAISTDCYEIAPGDDPAHKSYCAIGKIVGCYDDVEKSLALEVLSEYLCGSNQAPMKRRVLERGLAQEFYPMSMNGTLQNAFCFTFRDTDEDKLPELRAGLQQIVKDVLTDGLDQEELTACLNQFEFQFRERREPYGVNICISALQSWLYHGDPSLTLRMDSVFASLRAKLDSDYYAELLADLVLNEEGMCEVRLVPSGTLGEEKRAAAQARADAATADWTEAEKAAQQQQLAGLNTWHEQPDSAENLAKMPHLHLEEISAEPAWMPSTEKLVDGVRVLQTEIGTNGAVYIDMAFDLGDLTAEQLTDAKLLTALLTQLPTADHDVQTLQREIHMHLGSLEAWMQPIAKDDDVDHCTPYLMVGCSVLQSEVPHAVRLIREVLTTTRFEDGEAIRTLLQQYVSGMQQHIITGGHSMAMMKAAAGLSAEDYCAEAFNGFTWLDYMQKHLESFDVKAIGAAMNAISDKLTSNRLTVCISGSVDDEQQHALCTALPVGGEAQTQLFTLPQAKQIRSAYAIPAAVGFASLSCNYLRMGDDQRGTLKVAAKLLSLNWLWNEIRVKGGAYGAGLKCDASGSLTTYSYRDPDVSNSLKVYRAMADYLEAFCDEKKPLEEIIIGVMGEADPLMAPKIASRVVLQLALRAHTVEAERELRQQMVHADHDALRKCCKLLRDMAEQGSVCVVANEPSLEKLTDEQLTKIN